MNSRLKGGLLGAGVMLIFVVALAAAGGAVFGLIWITRWLAIYAPWNSVFVGVLAIVLLGAACGAAVFGEKSIEDYDE